MQIYATPMQDCVAKNPAFIYTMVAYILTFVIRVVSETVIIAYGWCQKDPDSYENMGP